MAKTVRPLISFWLISALAGCTIGDPPQTGGGLGGASGNATGGVSGTAAGGSSGATRGSGGGTGAEGSSGASGARNDGGGSAGRGGAGSAGAGGSAGSAGTAGTGTSGGAGFTVNDLLNLTRACQEVTAGRYATDSGEAPEIAVCRLNGALFWHADMDIDCDGQVTDVCNEDTDPWFQPQTSATDSNGDFLDASTLPFVVIPLPSSRFDYADHDIDLGSVAAVIYEGRIEFGVFADQGPMDIIGEASYAMAQRLGVDPDPQFGGTPSGVTYVVFTGAQNRVNVMEDHAEAVAVGRRAAQELVGGN